MMLQIARLLGFLAAILLLVAVGAWIRLFGDPELQRVDGSTTKARNKAEIASQLLLTAAALSALAASLAVIAWNSP
jgi:hypothetical protein